MQHAPYLSHLAQLYEGKALFAGVYIAEAHAADEWPVGARVSFCNQPRTLEERVALAKSFRERFEGSFPLLADTMDNQFMDAFAAWPYRFYIVQGGKVALKAMPDESGAGAALGVVSVMRLCVCVCVCVCVYLRARGIGAKLTRLQRTPWSKWASGSLKTSPRSAHNARVSSSFSLCVAVYTA